MAKGKKQTDDGLPKYASDPDYYCEHATKFCLLGATNADLGRMFDISERTVENWMKKHADFKHAIFKGRELADADVASSLYRRAKGWSHRATKIMQYQGDIVMQDYTERYPADVQAASLWLTNRQPKRWKNKVSNEHSGPDGDAITVRTIQRVIVDPKV